MKMEFDFNYPQVYIKFALKHPDVLEKNSIISIIQLLEKIQILNKIQLLSAVPKCSNFYNKNLNYQSLQDAKM